MRDASIPLLRIGKIENYLRVVDTKKDIDTTSENIEIISYESIDKLTDGIRSFNEYVLGSNIHLPYLDLGNIPEKEEMNLKPFGAKLMGAKLSGAKLLGANLSSANLSSTNLSGADLSSANLSDANLSSANLSDANLSGADLSGAILSRANLSSAILLGAKLSRG